MLTGEALFDAVAVDRDVLHDLLADGFARGVDGLEATRFTHGLGREVGVCTSAVPVTLHGLGVPVHVNAVVLGDALEQPASDPELVTNGDRAQDADLELPLTHHHFGVSAFDGETGTDAGQRVGFDDVTSGHLRATDAAVVRTLRGGEANFGPAVRTAVLVEGVFLLDAEPGLELAVLLLGGHGRGASVG